MGMAVTLGVSLTFAAGLFGLAVAWLLTSGMALASIRKRNFEQHKQWMVRSYVTTVAFISFRLVDDLMGYYGLRSSTDRQEILSWACWAVPLLITEVVLQSRQVFGGSRMVASPP